LQIGNFSFGVLKIGFGIGKVIAESLRVVVLPGNWICAVDVVWVNVT
jgi:hypothetical protein